MEIKRIKGGYDRNFSYMIIEKDTAILIDPFIDNKIDEIIEKENLGLKYIINTHRHFDHTQGNEHYSEKFGAEIIKYHEGLKEKEFGKEKIYFIHTPGHTEDSMCIKIKDKLFTGDTLFVGKVGGTSSEKESEKEWNSLKKIISLPDETKIYPGHDYGIEEFSTVKHEKENNPFLKKDFEFFLWLKENWYQYKKEHDLI